MKVLQPNLDLTAHSLECGSPLKTVLLAAIRIYQAFLSPLAFTACKFHPSCSRYAYEAVERYGARRGLRLALERLWRCRPFAPGGHDPVPEILEEVQ